MKHIFNKSITTTLPACIGLIAANLLPNPASAAIVYWDNTSGDAYGVASGTWSGATANWNTDSTGDTAAAGATTTTADTVNFGSATDGLGAGTINVGTASFGSMIFAEDSGQIILSGGTLTMAAGSTITTNNASDTITSVLAGNKATLTKDGTGTLILSGANTYADGTTVKGGTLMATQTSGTPFGGGAMTVGAAVLSIAPTGSDTDVSITNGTTGTVFTYNAGAVLSLNRGAQNSLTYTVGNGGNDVISRGTNGTLIISVSDIAKLGVATASNSERFIVNGTLSTTTNTIATGMMGQDRSNGNAGDFLTYNATNGYTRATYTLTNSFTGSNNTSVVNIATAMSTPTTSTPVYALKVGGVTLTNTGTITVGGSATGVAGLILNGATISGGTLTTPTAVGTEFIVYVSSAGGTITSNITTATAQAGMSVIGPGALTLSSSNSFIGGLRINNSIVIASNDNQLGSPTGGINLTGGTLQLSGTVALGGAGGQRIITLSAGQDKKGGTFDITSGVTTFQTAGMPQILTGTGALIKAGAGTLVLSGTTANNYTGGTFVKEGKLKLGASSMISGALTVDGGIFDLDTFSDTVGTVELANGGSIIGTGTATLTSTDKFDACSGLISAILAGSNIPLYKRTNDTFTLSGVNTYTGPTTVSAGTLLVSGSISGSAVTVQNGGTLGTSSGTTGGTTGAVTVQSGGTLAPGNSAPSSGLMTVGGNLAISGGGIFSVEINGTTAGANYDRVSVNGTVNIAGSKLTLGGSYYTPLVTNDLFFILLNDNSDAITGTFLGLNEGSHVYGANGQDYLISYRANITTTTSANFGTLQGNDIALIAIPEPDALLALLGGLGVLLTARRRRID